MDPPKPQLSWDDLLRLHAAIREASTQHPDTKDRFENLEQIRLEWERDREAIATEKKRLRESFVYESRDLLLLLFRLLKDGVYVVALWSVLWVVKWVTTIGLPMHGRLIETFHTVHELTALGCYLVLCVAVLWDAFDTRLKRRVRQAKKDV